MRRIVVLASLIVVLATLLNVAISLGFWWFGERPPPPDPPSFDPQILVDPRPLDLVVWRNRRGPDWPDEPRATTRQSYLGITFRSMLWIQIEWSGPIEDTASKVTKRDSYSIDVLESGWPLRCLSGERWIERHGGFATPPQVTSGMPVAFGAYWPNRVLCLGMMINELFYVLLIVSTFCTWCYGRRWIRRRRGRCPRCAYDLRGDSGGGCPECGWKRDDGTTPADIHPHLGVTEDNTSR